MMKLLFLAATAFAICLSVQPADAIVPGHPAVAHASYDYQQMLLAAFFAIASSALLVTLAMHYYRIQWGRRSLLTE